MTRARLTCLKVDEVVDAEQPDGHPPAALGTLLIA